MLVQTTYALTQREQRLARSALGGLDFLPMDWYRDENPDKGRHLNDLGDFPAPIRHATEDIRWLLWPSGSQISADRLARVFVSLAMLLQVVKLQSDPEWWSARGAPTHLAETRRVQLLRIDELISELGQRVNSDPEEEDDD
jgi:hypothetical protein